MTRIAVVVFLTTFLHVCNADDFIKRVEYEPSTNYPGTVADVINRYRQDQGLPAIPISVSLTLVAEAHVKDLQDANPVTGSCNLHSWSNQGNWSSCCYTDDHAQAECMWNKPSEITGGIYSGSGYEISSIYSGNMTPNIALDSWRGSDGHRDIILNKNTWENFTWNAIGGAVSENYAVVWLGKELDPTSSRSLSISDTHAEASTLNVCIDYHCERQQKVTLPHAEQKIIMSPFKTIAKQPREERKQISQSIALLEQYVGLHTGTHVDAPENQGEDEPGQLDCISESRNTAHYLKWLDQKNKLKWHQVKEPVRRATLMFDPHWTAVIRDKGTGQQYAVDSWPYKNGEAPVIQNLEQWMAKQPARAGHIP